MAESDSRFIGRTLPPLLGEFDPLEARHLRSRFRTFEIACLPGVLAQTNKDFTWVLAVDRALAPEWHGRLASLTQDHPRTIIHEYDPLQPLGEVDWLAPYLDTPAPNYLLTTNLDDDDALPPRFVQEIQSWVMEREDRLAPVEIFGATDLVQWDLEVTKTAPLGYEAEWHRDVAVTSTGFSLLARYPDYPLTVMALGHPVAPRLLDWSDVPGPEFIGIHRERELLKQAAAKVGDSLSAYDVTETFHDTVPRIGRPLITNHTDNAQATRLHERKERHAVKGAESFPNAVIDWEAFATYANTFRRTPAGRARYLARRQLTWLRGTLWKRGGRLKHRLLVGLRLR